MASAIIEISDAPDEQCDIKVSFMPVGIDSESPAHQVAAVALEAIASPLNDIASGDDRQSKFDLVAHLIRQRAFSERTFGPGARTAGVLAHIRRELVEIEANPGDVAEWIDVVLLAFDGAWRAGFTPEQIAEALAAKQARNEARAWPDWRTAARDEPIEHVRAAGEAP